MRSFAVSLALLFCATAPALRGGSGSNYAVARELIAPDTQALNLHGGGGALPCTVLSYKPELGFDFRFHARYSVILRRKDLLKRGEVLTIVLRVSPEDDPEAPVRIVQHFQIPGFDKDPEGQWMVEGSFLLGVGQYRVDWQLQDTNERVCARYWDVETRIKGRDSILDEAVPKHLIQRNARTPFESLPVHESLPGPRRHVKIIVNFAPPNPEKVTLDPHVTASLALILRAILREPGITSFSVIACSLRTQQILYTSRNSPDVDLAAIGAALAGIKLGIVDAKTLAVRNGETEFLKSLLTEEMRDTDYDAMIFVGPKYPLKVNIPDDTVDELKDSVRPLFYLNYEHDPSAYPWRDAIGRFVKSLHGREYHICQPRDLFSAWSDVVSRLNLPKPQD